jgi:hypothetical protein
MRTFLILSASLIATPTIAQTEYERAQQCHNKYPELYGHVMILPRYPGDPTGAMHCVSQDADGNFISSDKPCTAQCEISVQYCPSGYYCLPITRPPR